MYRTFLLVLSVTMTIGAVRSIAQTGDDCADPFIVGALPYTHSACTCDFNNLCDISGPDVAETVYRMDVVTRGYYVVSLCNTPWDTKMAIFLTDCCTGPGTEWFYYDNGGNCSTFEYAEFHGIMEPGTYYIIVDSYFYEGTYTLDIWEEPIGRCCFPGAQCVDDALEEDCLPDGQWTPGLNCTDDPCPVDPVGVCCFNGNCLDDYTQLDCTSINGDWYIGEQCANFQCPQVDLGACCSSSGCYDIDQINCDGLGGEWFPGLTCADLNNCSGACCVGASCVGDMNRAICETVFSGTWYPGETCTNFNCADPVLGACCVNDNCAGNFTEATCLSFGGTWYAGEDCATYDCGGSANVPTIDEWGMMILALTLLLIGTVAVIRRRKKIPHRI